jgi:LysR family glycine cleavage system transcriptional activator
MGRVGGTVCRLKLSAMSFHIDRRRLPHMSALVAFEAAARLGSFVEAGEEVHLTASAISRQVKALEEQLGAELFERVRQRVRLTAAGEFYATQVRQTLGRLLDASQQTSQWVDGRRTLNVGVLAAFANHWLIRRLPSLVRRHPDLNINLVTYGSGYSYEDDGEIDCVLHTSSRAWPDAVAHRLGDEEFIAVASPHWIAENGVNSPADLPMQTLLVHPTRPLWPQWFQQNGVALPVRPREFRLGQYSMVMQGALASLGAALVPRLLAQDDLDAARLQEIPGQSVYVTAGYLLVYAAGRAEYSPLQDFRDWLLAEVGAVPPSAAPLSPPA